jgi:hypothetical protein
MIATAIVGIILFAYVFLLAMCMAAGRADEKTERFFNERTKA